MNLSDPVTTIPFIGEKYRKLLKKLNIETVEDLLRHYPTRYEDLSTVRKISELVVGEKATICAEVLEVKNIRTKHGKLLTKAIVGDESGTLLIVWFNQPYLTNAIRAESLYNFSEELKSFSGRPALLGPEYEKSPNSLGSEGKGPGPSLSGPGPREFGPFPSDSFPRPAGTIHTGRLVPIYPETAGVSSKWLRSRINHVIHTLVYNTTTTETDPLPEIIREKHGLINLNEALRKIHFPQNQGEVTEARKRLSFEEMFLLQLRSLKKRREWEERRTAVSLQLSRPPVQVRPPDLSGSRTGDDKKISKFIESLPFELTGAQKRCIDEILSDLKRTTPMNRLLQGDVGCGKTVVAATAAYATVLCGYQTAYMAPTEILAQQVHKVFKEYLEPFGIEILLQTGSTKLTADSRPQNQPVRGGQLAAGVIVGTHALLHRPELFDKLALVIIDEQHRFGVKQRSKLLRTRQRDAETTRYRNSNEGSRHSEGAAATEESPKKRSFAPPSGAQDDEIVTPHLLTMTATPIPRSLALTTYGHLDISIINEMPPGVIPTKTWLVPEKKRQAGYEWIKKQLDSPAARQRDNNQRSAGPPAKEKSLNSPESDSSQSKESDYFPSDSGELAGPKNQAFVICPLIEESEHETFEDVKAVTTEFERLKKIFPEFNLGLLHGKIKSQEKEKIINNFKAGEIQILVSTPVVEVGIDIPQANIMIIEGAHRFGLASLHQLRGRVGRAGQESYCLLFTPKQTERIARRLKALEKTHSGLELAEVDLKIRGPGEICGVKQHGVPNLKIASLLDLTLVRTARTTAEEIITEIGRYPALKEKLEIADVSPN